MTRDSEVPEPKRDQPARRSETSRAVAAGDEVDRLATAWLRERPDLDIEPVTVFSRVARLARHLERARRAAFVDHELEGFEFDVLAALRRAGPPYELSPGQLLVQTLVASGTMTNRLDRLERRGLVRRRRDASDRRGVQVRLTGRGRAKVDAAFVALLDRERLLLAGLPAADRQTLATLLRKLLAPLDRPAGPVGPVGSGSRNGPDHPDSPREDPA